MTTWWPSPRSPRSGGSSADSSRISVDLPAPLWPTSAMRSPRSMCSVDIARGRPLARRPCARPSARSTMRPLFGAAGKLEVDALALGRNLDALDLLEHLDAALHLRGLGRLVAEAIDEFLDARDLLVLPLLRLAQPVEPRVALDQVVRVVAVVVGKRAQRQIGDARDDRVEEVAIVRDEDDRVRIGARDTPRASCARRDRDGWSARRAAAGRAGRGAAWRARAASASLPRGGRSASSKSSCSKPRPRSTVATFSSR